MAGAFPSTELTQLVGSPFGTVPEAVAVACAWLFVVCQAGNTVVSVHPNATGYAQIAAAFGAVLGQAPGTPTSTSTPTPAVPALAFTGFDASGTAILGATLAVLGCCSSVAVELGSTPGPAARRADGCGREDSNLHPPEGTGT